MTREPCPDPRALGETPVQALENAAADVEALRASYPRRTNADAAARRALTHAAFLLMDRALMLRCGKTSDKPETP